MRKITRHIRMTSSKRALTSAGALIMLTMPSPHAYAWQCGIPVVVKSEADGPTQPAENVNRHSALPSTMVKYIHTQNYLQPEWHQQAIAWPLLDIARQEDLNDHERFFLGQLEFMSLKPDPAYAIFSEYADRDDWYGWMARQRLATMDTRAYRNFERLEKNLKEDRKNFDFNPDYASTTGMAERSLCTHWRDEGEHEKAVNLAVETAQSTPRDAAYGSLYVIGACFSSFAALDRESEAFEIADSIRNDLKKSLNKRLKKSEEYPAYDPELHENLIEDRWYGRSTIAPYNYANYKMEDMIDWFDTFLACTRDGQTEGCPSRK